jgi:DNA-binding transcriptional ArsR family regulator
MSRYACTAPDVAAVAALIADPSRAAMVIALMDDRAWTLGELASHVGVARSTASEHASALVAGGLCEEQRQGRHRYLRLASPAVASALEALGSLASKDVEVRPALRAASTTERCAGDEPATATSPANWELD